MKAFTARAVVVRALLGAALLTAVACTPLQVLTHSVSQDEARVPAGRYDLDADHCSIIFDVEHFKYSRFAMRLDRKKGQLQWNQGGLAQSSVSVSIDAASIDTNVPLLDNMVKSASLLDVEQYPEIRFVSTKFERTGDARGTLTGDLTIHGVTQPVTLDVTFNGFARDPLTKKDTLGFSAEGRFSRAKFGLATWYPAVGDDIHVHIEAEFGRTPAGA